MEAPRYLAGDSFIGRRDPRVLILVPALAVVVLAQIEDLRLMLVATAVSFTYYAAARIPFAEVRHNWACIGLFVFLMAGINGLIVGAQQYPDAVVIFEIPVIGLPVSTASVSYTLTLLLRFLSIAATGFPLAFGIRPGDLAVAFARLGIPDRFAYAIDLTFKFLPTTAASLHETVAAQRLRGYEASGSRNPITRIKQIRPLVVPVTVGAFVEAEDVADALDLRGFGTQPRTWVRELRLDRTDISLLAAAVLVAIAITVANVGGWLPGLWLW